MAQKNHKVADIFFEKPMFAAVLQEKGGFYDLDMVESALVEATETCGGLELNIPKIPLLTKDEKTFTFSPNDIRALKRSIEGQGVTT